MRMNIQSKIIAAFLSLIIFLVTILGILSYEKARQILIAEKRKATLKNMEIAKDFFINKYINEIEQAVNTLAKDPKLTDTLIDSSALADPLKDWENYRKFNPDIWYIYMATREGKIYVSPDWNAPEDYDPRARPWYEAALRKRGKITWSDPYLECISNRTVISAVKTIESPNYLVGVLGIDTSLHSLSEIIKKIKFEEGGYAILLDKSGHIIAHPKEEMLGRNISYNNWFYKLPTADEGVVFLNLDGVPTLVAYVTIPQTGWKLVGFIPPKTIEKQIAPIRNRTISVGLISIIIAIVVSVFISNKIAQKIRKLISLMTEVEKGDFGVRCNYRSSDEFMELGIKFNKMVATIEKLIKERQKTEEELQLQKTYFQQLFEDSPESIVILDNQDRIVDINKQFTNFFQYSLEEIKNRYINDVIVPDDLMEEGLSLTRNVLNREVIEKETTRRRKDGTLVEVFVIGYPIMFNGEQVGIYGIYRDITDRKAAEKQLRYLILHDPLTGVYNRAYFEQQMRNWQKDNKGVVGIIICDLDGLKLVNDTLGHDIGDKLLKSSARVIQSSLPEAAVLCRIGGDEFAVLIPNTNKRDIGEICKNIKDSVEKFNQGNEEFSLSISFGFALGKPGGNKLKEIFKEADNNMYREKLHRSQSARSTIVKTLMKALEARDFITEGHGDRMQKLVENLARAVAIPENKLGDLRLLAQFHDIGKVGIADRVLFKPGTLTPEEMEEMRRHSEIGYRIAMASQELNPIADWILKHHEWWNGGGYPIELKGEEIPLECRILAIVDAYDAMTNQRPYREAMSHQEAVQELMRESGSKFDPYLVNEFIKLLD